MAKAKSKDIATIADLKPDPHNANKGTERGKGMVDDSIRRYGAGRSIVTDKNGVVIGGNKTLDSARALGFDIQVVRTDGKKLVVVQREDLDLLTDENARKLAYADNRAGELGLAWDADQITADLDAGIDLTDMFSVDDLSDIGIDIKTEPEEAPEAQMDAAEELQEKWQVKDGDVWQIGEHRLMCGDNRNKDNFTIVSDGYCKDVFLTDPPYGLGDTVSDKNNYATYKDSLEGLFDLINTTINTAICEFTRSVITPGNSNQYKYPEPTWCMCWYIPAGVGRGPWGFCCWQPIMCYGKDVKLANGLGSFPDSISMNGTPSSDGHPCAKPMALWCWIMERVSLKTENIYDPFLGSGTTMVAAEQLGRKCYGMEIEPKYCAVILERMSAMGLVPELVSNAREA